MTWEREKEITARRVLELSRQMQDAIDRHDREMFMEAYTKSFRYMLKRERVGYYRRFLEAVG